MNNLLRYTIAGTAWLMLPLLTLQAQELWMEYGMNYSMPKNLSLGVAFNNRFQNIGNYVNYKNATEIALDYRLSKNFKLGGSYRYTAMRNPQNTREEDAEDDRQRYAIDFQVKIPVDSRMELKNRSRYQLSLEDFGDPRRFYRNKTSLDIRIDKKTSFYFSEEFFFRLQADKPMENRTTCGFEYELLRNFRISPFYLVEREVIKGNARHSYALGIGALYEF